MSWSVQLFGLSVVRESRIDDRVLHASHRWTLRPWRTTSLTLYCPIFRAAIATQTATLSSFDTDFNFLMISAVGTSAPMHKIDPHVWPYVSFVLTLPLLSTLGRKCLHVTCRLLTIVVECTGMLNVLFTFGQYFLNIIDSGTGYAFLH